MSNADLLPSLPFKMNENQLVLEASIMELTNWVEQRGSGDVAQNEEFINLTLTVLRSPECPLPFAPYSEVIQCA